MKTSFFAIATATVLILFRNEKKVLKEDYLRMRKKISKKDNY